MDENKLQTGLWHKEASSKLELSAAVNVVKVQHV